MKEIFVSEELEFGLEERFLKGIDLALDGVAQLVGASSCNPMVTGSTPSQGTYLGCGFNPWSRSVGRNQSMLLSCIDVSLLPFLFPSSVQEKAMEKMSLGKDKKKPKQEERKKERN